MCVITVQIGQCGNQVGYCLFSYMAKDILNCEVQQSAVNTDYINTATDKWFTVEEGGTLTARAIAIDTELKPINQLTNGQTDFQYKHFVVDSSGGSGNNWAHGYMIRSKNLVQQTVDIVRTEAERCNGVTSILILLSSSGGTGSGVGCRVVELLRDQFPNKVIIVGVVLPYSSGEVVTQNYNTVLTLDKLDKNSDMCILFENDQLHGMAEKFLLNKDISLNDLNNLIAKKLASVFQPLENNSLQNIVGHLSSHPSYKYVTIKTSPHISKENARYETVTKWSSLVSLAKQTLRIPQIGIDWETRYASSASRQNINYSQSVSNLLIARGKIENELPVEMLTDCVLYPRWIPEDSRLLCSRQPRRLYDTEHFLSFVTNNSNIYKPLENIVEKGWTMFSHGACFHQYAKFGLEESDFTNAFLQVETIIKKYKDLQIKQ